MKKNQQAPVEKSQSSWVISHFPEKYEQYTYLEPFGGSVNILVEKAKSPMEVIADTDLSVVQMLRAIRDECKELGRRLARLSPSQDSLDRAVGRRGEAFQDYMDQAANEFVCRAMVAGRQAAKKWQATLASLSDVSERIKEVHILHKSGIDIIPTFNSTNSLVFADPPHLYETKAGKHVYDSEMSPESHIELARRLTGFKGKAIICGQPSLLYDRLYKGWKVEKSGRGKAAECLWKNY